MNSNFQASPKITNTFETAKVLPFQTGSIPFHKKMDYYFSAYILPDRTNLKNLRIEFEVPRFRTRIVFEFSLNAVECISGRVCRK